MKTLIIGVLALVLMVSITGCYDRSGKVPFDYRSVETCALYADMKIITIYDIGDLPFAKRKEALDIRRDAIDTCTKIGVRDFKEIFGE